MKTRYFLAGLVGIVLVAGMGASTFMSFKTVDGMKSLSEDVSTMKKGINKKIDSALGVNQDVKAEDNINIMGGYVIKSTKNISDAYINGDSSSLEGTDKETFELASKVIDDIIKDNMSDYEKELAVYDWLTMYASQNVGMMSAISTGDFKGDTPYSVLKGKTAVCVGYATTFRLFMQMLGIDCMVVHSSDLTHSWNLVKLDDEWYHTDIYSDAGIGNYRNFNMNDNLCITTHEWDRDFFPAAVGTEYSYGNRNNEIIDDIYDIPQIIKNRMMDGDRSAVFLKIKGLSDVSDEKVMIIEDMMQKISTRLMESENSDIWMEWNWTQKDAKDDMILGIYVTKTLQESSSLSEEQKNKVNDALNKVFGEYTWNEM